IVFILIFALDLLILQTEKLIYILFLAVFGFGAVWTIDCILYFRENILQTDRSHLCQYLRHEGGVNKLLVSFLYGLIQLLIGLAVIYVATLSLSVQITFAVVLLVVLSAAYLVGKTYVIRKFVKA